MQRLLINADDFGLTPGVSRAIVELFRGGRISSTTAMLCVPDAGATLLAARDVLRGRVGLHLQLTGGAPCLPASQVPTLAVDGQFPLRRSQIREVCVDEVFEEWSAQLQAFCGTGLHPTHLDCHHHVQKIPAVFAAYCRLAKQHGLPVRACSSEMVAQLRQNGIASPDGFEDRWSTGTPQSLEMLLRLLEEQMAKHSSTAVIELMVHPGYVDEPLLECSTFTISRETEMAALQDPRFADWLETQNIQLSPNPWLR